MPSTHGTPCEETPSVRLQLPGIGSLAFSAPRSRFFLLPWWEPRRRKEGKLQESVRGARSDRAPWTFKVINAFLSSGLSCHPDGIPLFSSEGDPSVTRG